MLSIYPVERWPDAHSSEGQFHLQVGFAVASLHKFVKTFRRVTVLEEHHILTVSAFAPSDPKIECIPMSPAGGGWEVLLAGASSADLATWLLNLVTFYRVWKGWG